MSPKKRFDYLQSSGSSTGQQDTNADSASKATNTKEPVAEINEGPQLTEAASGGEDPLSSVPRGEGRMEQDREQLNVRIPKLLKRKAMAKAILAGVTIGDVIEEMLLEYVNEEKQSSSA